MNAIFIGILVEIVGWPYPGMLEVHAQLRMSCPLLSYFSATFLLNYIL